MTAPAILMLEDEAYRVDLLRECLSPFPIYATDFIPDFLDRILRVPCQMLFLDHDLNPENLGPNGLDATRALVDPAGPYWARVSYVPIVVHSLNPSGAGQILSLLSSWEAPVIRVPFHRLPEYSHWLKRLLTGEL